MDKKIRILTAGQVRSRTIVSFCFFLVFIGAVVFAWKALQQQPKEHAALLPLRKVLNANETLFSGMFGNSALSKTYPISAAAERVRLNGNIGMKEKLPLEDWKFTLIKKAGDSVFIGLDEIKRLPKTEIIFDFKCIEGWSQVSRWAGVKMTDFMKAYGLSEEAALKFAGLSTPGNGYYVGVDMKSMLHPQTILCYEMNGKDLTPEHGYPLRLIIPVKYGVKHLKRIGTLYFSNSRPPDYWYERGYDYYCGL